MDRRLLGRKGWAVGISRLGIEGGCASLTDGFGDAGDLWQFMEKGTRANLRPVLHDERYLQGVLGRHSPNDFRNHLKDADRPAESASGILYGNQEYWGLPFALVTLLFFPYDAASKPGQHPGHSP